MALIILAINIKGLLNTPALMPLLRRRVMLIASYAIQKNVVTLESVFGLKSSENV